VVGQVAAGAAAWPGMAVQADLVARAEQSVEEEEEQLEVTQAAPAVPAEVPAWEVQAVAPEAAAQEVQAEPAVALMSHWQRSPAPSARRRGLAAPRPRYRWPSTTARPCFRRVSPRLLS